MATPRPEPYVGDPYKILLTNAGSEMGHVFHEHGGAIRWLRNPGAANPDIAGGLEKFPPVTKASIRLDSQTIEPGESYDLETECGAGGCQQAAGDFLFHCHIAAHYDAGMVGFIRVFDTQQPNLADGAGPHGQAGGGHLGRPDRQGHRGQDRRPAGPAHQPQHPGLPGEPGRGPAPAAGRPVQRRRTRRYGTGRRGGTATAPVYLGEPEDTHSWADYTAPNPGSEIRSCSIRATGDTPGRCCSPTSVNDRRSRPTATAGRPGSEHDARPPDRTACARQGAPVRTYNITAIQTPIHDQTDSGRDASGNPIDPQSDPNGEIFVLNQHIAAMRSGAMPAQPLAIRSDVGDCIAVTLTNDLSPSSAGLEATNEENIFRKVNIHIHFVQFDPQASDGVITGLSFEQSVRPDHRRDAGRDDADRGRAGRRDPDHGGQHHRAAPGYQHRGRPGPTRTPRSSTRSRRSTATR